MPNPKTDHTQEPLALLYLNGESAVSGEVAVPRFKDICLDKKSQNACEELIEETRKYNHPIRNEKECQDYIALHSLVDERVHDLRKLAHDDRQEWNKILSQISAAIEPMLAQLISISGQLTKTITKWRALVVEGQRREEQRLLAEAEEKRALAKYSDDPKKRRQASVQAERLEKEAKEVAPKPEKGLDTEEYAEFEINNRTIAAKLPDELVRMDVDDREGNRRLKAAKQAGEKITPNFFPGLTIIWKTRVRFHK
jgi:hypothetical protein